MKRSETDTFFCPHFSDHRLRFEPPLPQPLVFWDGDFQAFTADYAEGADNPRPRALVAVGAAGGG